MGFISTFALGMFAMHVLRTFYNHFFSKGPQTHPHVLTIQMSEAVRNRMQDLADTYEKKSVAAVIQHALAIYELLLKRVYKDKCTLYIEEQDGTRTPLEMPHAKNPIPTRAESLIVEEKENVVYVSFSSNEEEKE